MEADFEEMESRLLYLEDLCAQCDHQRYKHFQVLQLENYKKKKGKNSVYLLLNKGPRQFNVSIMSFSQYFSFLLSFVPLAEL